MGRILVIDDERSVLAAFAETLGGLGHTVSTASQAEAGLEQLRAAEFDVVVLDIRMPGMDGLQALEQVKASWPRLPVIVMTGYGTMETAIEATKRGAFEYQLKPFEPAEIVRLIERAMETSRLMRDRVAFGSEPPPPAGETIVGHSEAMQAVYKAIGRVAPTDATVLIRGESGTGKELVARAVYQHSRRCQQPMLVVNCAAVPETLLESELFGHERGAFTGAAARRIGKWEQADGATLFLDEIGDIPLAVQAKILRVLQENTFQRLGSNDTIRSDVRVLAATNRDLEKGIAEGTFREDLYHRLNVVTIVIPPLRERKEDIPDLIDFFLARFAAELAIEKPLVSPDAMQTLVDYPWPGNVRELQHCLHRATIFTRGFPIQTADLAPLLASGAEPGATGPPASVEEPIKELIRLYLDSYRGERAHEQLLERVEKTLLLEALQRTGGNQASAARLLGMARPTLHAKMQRHGLREPPSEN